ncbi:MAG: hypothetical protein DWQ18_03200 [Crenarchaeota archaeon]|nr:MAG: hypothetical protein DWQ17_05330 [Thermoproteota archaeon]RDJ33931.1 MAG: hypothetical protein DWQ18_03200 [Thermoproteota archaeon]RDJ36957.1 MAG: hypothetical protein DWQ13_07420 [Thermoproteota archaeon]RDJ37508.1 MAG: hypothetical protein DWQ19_03415 [Thermoproteota archaeon]
MYDTTVYQNISGSSDSFLKKFDGYRKLTKPNHKKSIPVLFGMIMSLMVGGMTILPENAYSEEQSSIDQIRLEAEAEFANEIQKAKSILNEIKNNPNSNEQDIELAMIEYKKSVAIAKQIRDEKIQNAQLTLEKISTVPKISLADARKQLKLTVDTAHEQLQKAIESAKSAYDSAIRDALGDKGLEKQAELEYESALKTAKETYNKIVYEATKQYQKMRDVINV